VERDDSPTDGEGKDSSFDTEDDNTGPALLLQDLISSTSMSSASRVGSSPVASVGRYPFFTNEKTVKMKKLKSLLPEVNGENLEESLELQLKELATCHGPSSIVGRTGPPPDIRDVYPFVLSFRIASTFQANDELNVLIASPKTRSRRKNKNLRSEMDLLLYIHENESRDNCQINKHHSANQQAHAKVLQILLNRQTSPTPTTNPNHEVRVKKYLGEIWGAATTRYCNAKDMLLADIRNLRRDWNQANILERNFVAVSSLEESTSKSHLLALKRLATKELLNRVFQFPQLEFASLVDKVNVVAIDDDETYLKLVKKYTSCLYNKSDDKKRIMMSERDSTKCLVLM
jgi:hypothetical protein